MEQTHDYFYVKPNNPQKSEAIQKIEQTILTCYDDSDTRTTHEKKVDCFEAIRAAINENENFIIPISIPNEELEMLRQDTENKMDGDSEAYNLTISNRTLNADDGTCAGVAFTSLKEAQLGAPSSFIPKNIEKHLHDFLMDPDADGVVINPWSSPFYLSKTVIIAILEANLPPEYQNDIFIETGDVNQLDIGCIVHAANSSCENLQDCQPGEVTITEDSQTKANYVIHTVVPDYHGTEKDAILLRDCYWNSLELAKEYGMHSIAFPAMAADGGEYPVKEAAEIGLKTISDWFVTHHHYGMTIVVTCREDSIIDIYRNMWDENYQAWAERPLVFENDGRLERAIAFAMEHHKGACRKGSQIPYITHPLETMQILNSMNADIHMLMAGVLHDTLEDTDATLREILDEFGLDVAALVNGHTDDKQLLWYNKRLLALRQLEKDSPRQKMLILADKVSNLRCMWKDYKTYGDDLWNRFRAPKEMQSWYYSKANDCFENLQQYDDTKDVYWEMTSLYKNLFVTFYLDETHNIIYQSDTAGDTYMLQKGEPGWVKWNDAIPDCAIPIQRAYAERLEDNWFEEIEIQEK